MTEGGDIGFRVYSKDSKGHEDLFPPCRVDSHLVMEEGQVICNQPGNCKLFDLPISNYRT